MFHPIELYISEKRLDENKSKNCILIKFIIFHVSIVN
jgi:hypothetical protein